MFRAVFFSGTLFKFDAMVLNYAKLQRDYRDEQKNRSQLVNYTVCFFVRGLRGLRAMRKRERERESERERERERDRQTDRQTEICAAYPRVSTPDGQSHRRL